MTVYANQRNEELQDCISYVQDALFIAYKLFCTKAREQHLLCDDDDDDDDNYDDYDNDDDDDNDNGNHYLNGNNNA